MIHGSAQNIIPSNETPIAAPSRTCDVDLIRYGIDHAKHTPNGAERHKGRIADAFIVARPHPANAAGQEIPHLDRRSASTQLIVDGRPFIIFGGELGNSSAGTAAEADRILPRLARAHINTVLMPVAWDQLEAVEGQFDFAILDHWIEQARTQRLHLVLLWFASWKNAFSSYAQDWVKKDPKRFPRAMAPGGHPLEILSTLSKENLDADSRAFRALLRHLKEFDSQQQTVLLVQVENEVGILGSGRDHSEEADRLFAASAPDALVHAIRAHPEWFQSESNRALNPNGHTWQEVFGDDASEAFTAWNYARYIGQVAAAGKNGVPAPDVRERATPCTIRARRRISERWSAPIRCSSRKQNPRK